MNIGRADVRRWWPAERDPFDEAFAKYVDEVLAQTPDSRR